MYSPRKKLPTPVEYGFPYEPPYDIQQNLMESLYEVLEQKRIGIFESPTGTGKSLTLTCGALRWLLDHEELVRKDLQERIDEITNEIQLLDKHSNEALDWIQAQYETVQRRKELNEMQQLQLLLQAHEKRLQVMRERAVTLKSSPDQRKKYGNSVTAEKRGLEDNNVDEELQLGDLEPVTEFLDTVSPDDDEPKTVLEEEIWKDVKIYFCSRTHSQLAQVMREVKRTTYGKHIRCISLASRQQLCINPQVRRLPNVALMNERCLDMARNNKCTRVSTPSDTDVCALKKPRLQTITAGCGGKCAYKAAATVQELGENALMQTLDIEDLITAGERMKACPYYASRIAARSAQLIMLPYQMLLHRKTRIQSGIDLRNSVIIIDEAHNLLDTIAQIHSAEITLQQLALVQQQVTAYKMRYSARFSSANLLKINQLNFIIKRLIKLLTPSSAATPKQENISCMLRTHELMSDGEFYNINIFHILEFCERTRFAQKLQGFVKRMKEEPKPSENQQPLVQTETGALCMLKRLQKENIQRQTKRSVKITQQDAAPVQQQHQENHGQQSQLSTSSPIRPILTFLETLTECAEDGRILLTIDTDKDAKRSGMKYLLLNPGEHFQEILREARSIIIAGGTMQPTAELTDQLFKSCSERVVQKFYAHVVPPDAVLPFVVTKGPTGKHFCFNYAHRNNVEMLSELGMTLQNLCNVIPAGVVCFFPSYDFMEVVYKHFQQHGFLDRISQKKHVFREPRSTAANGQTVEQMLAEYAAVIERQEKNGALLLSVVGGKLSEGLNFADDLGRCVVVIGMPYPNRNSPELQERMKYLDSTLSDGAGNEYYENLCMKAINQCIGRSVRHINDYACVMLLDERYANERVQRKLPQWIARSLKTPTAFGHIQGTTAKFFKAKR